MRLYFLCATLLILTLTSQPAAASAKWYIVAVPQSSNQDDQVLNISRPFQVILTNGTLHDMKVWKDSCSNGYFNLSFEFKGKDGKVITVEKNLGAVRYDKSADAVVVNPGCDYSIMVNLSAKNGSHDKVWASVEKLSGPMSLRVIYQNSNTANPGQKSKDSAWIGIAKSDPMPVIIAR